MTKKFREEKNFYWDDATPTFLATTDLARDINTDIVTTNWLVKEYDLIQSFYNRIVREEWVYTVLGVFVGGIISVLWVRRSGE